MQPCPKPQPGVLSGVLESRAAWAESGEACAPGSAKRDRRLFATPAAPWAPYDVCEAATADHTSGKREELYW